jgi:hypothetical protein
MSYNNGETRIQFGHQHKVLCRTMFIQSIQQVCAPDDYSTKTRKNILKSFNHLP